jgi:hypothetical protein
LQYDYFIDESCHLENDKIPIMCVGSLKVPHHNYSVYRKALAIVFANHRFYKELKWNEFSGVRLDFYKNLVDYFFASPIDFRCVIVKYKDRLNHEDFNKGSHDNFYYKMIFYLLRFNLDKKDNYRVYIDLKDTRGRSRLKKINEVFENFMEGSNFRHFQHIQSHDNLFIQLSDFLIGAVAYKSRLSANDITEPSSSKLEFIEYLENAAGYTLDEGTPLYETKFNIFDHQPKLRR